MTAVLGVILCWMLFAGSHILLSTSPVRPYMVARLGRIGQLLVYCAIAWVLFGLLVVYYARHFTEGPPGIGAGASTIARPPLLLAIVLGWALIGGAAAPRQYVSSTFAPLQVGVRAPYGLERVTRHAFFSGLVLVFGAHALMAAHLVGMVFFLGFAVLAIVGPLHQAAKLRAERGPELAGYYAATSAIPLGAILTGRQRFAWREMPWPFIAAGLALAWGLRTAHPHLLAFDGVPFALAFNGVTAVFVVQGILRERTRSR